MKTLHFLIKTIFSIIILLVVNASVLGVEKKQAYLGIHISDLDESDIKISGIPYGVIVNSVIDDSPAEKAGLKEYDIIQAFNNQKIEDTDVLYDMVKETEPGTKVSLTFLRQGEKKSTEVTMGKRRTYKNYLYSSHPLHKNIFMFMGFNLGIHLQGISAELGEYFGVREEEGVLVLSVSEESPAEKAGMKAGDVIIQIGDEKIKDPEDVLDSISDYDEDETINITIIRHKKQMSLQVEIDEEDDTIDIFKWHGHMPGKHLRMYGNRKGHQFFDFDRDRDLDFEPGNAHRFRGDVLRLKDRKLLLQNKIREKFKKINTV